MGIVNIVEGSIPIVMNDIVRGIAAAAIGGACGGAVTMVYGADATVPFGGVLMIPTMSHPMAGIMALLVNIVVTATVYAVIKKIYRAMSLLITITKKRISTSMILK